MKKTLLAAALIVGFAGVAQAETSVTMYGILDTGYGYQNYKYDGNAFGGDVTSKSSGLRSGVFNGNRWGVRGSEDLGDGLRAVFTLEAGFDIGDGNNGSGPQGSVSNKFFHRQAFVGLASDNWGSLTMGRQYNIGTALTYNANSSVVMGDMDKTFGGVGLGNRMDNSFKYMTPNFSGFQAGVAYGTGSDATAIIRTPSTVGDEDRTNWLSTGIGYANGPITAGLSYDRASPTGANSDSISNWTVSGSYDFEVVKLALAYGQDSNGKLGWGNLDQGLAGTMGLPGIGDDFKSKNYYVALSAPVGPGTLVGSWSRSTSNLDDADKWADAAGNQNIYQVNYKYPLSKRTSLYGYASYGTNLGYVDDLDGTEAGIGINHKF